jgi:hypothetical protein
LWLEKYKNVKIYKCKFFKNEIKRKNKDKIKRIKMKEGIIMRVKNEEINKNKNKNKKNKKNKE